MPNEDQGYIGSFVLPVVTESVRRQVDLEQLNWSNISIEHYLDHVGRDLVFQLTRRRAKQILPSTTVRFPDTWWDHFKERWFPTILKDMFPITYREVIVGADAYYDHLLMKDDVSEVRLHLMETAKQSL